MVKIQIGLLLTLLSIGITTGVVRAQQLTADTYEQLRDHILPEPDELAYLKLSWRTRLRLKTAYSLGSER